MPELTVNQILDIARRGAMSVVDGLSGIYEACKYPEQLTTDDFVNMYEREGVPARIVDIWPDECWSVPPEAYEDDDPDTVTAYEEVLDTLVQQKRLWRVLHEADRLSGVGEYGGVYYGIDDATSVEDLARPPKSWPTNPDGTEVNYGAVETELPHQAPPAHKLLFMRPLSQNNMAIDAIENNPTSPRYGLPKMYTVRFGGTTNTSTGSENATTVDSNSYKIHWTRILHVPSDGAAANPVLGRPRMKRVFNRCLDLARAYGGSAQSLWNGGFPGISFETAPGFEDAEVEDEAGLKQQMADYASGFKRWIWSRGVKANQLQPGITDPSKFVDVYLQNIGASIGVPWRKLMGSEQGQLASGQDGETWDRRVEARCKERCDKDILVPCLRRLIWLGVLPLIEEIKTEWASRVEPKPSEVAATAKSETETLAMYVEKDVAQLVPPSEFLENVMKWPKERIEAVQTASGSFQDFERLRKATHEAAVKGAAQLAKGEQPGAADKPPGTPAKAPAAAPAGKAPPTAPAPAKGKPAPAKAPQKAPPK